MSWQQTTFLEAKQKNSWVYFQSLSRCLVLRSAFAFANFGCCHNSHATEPLRSASHHFKTYAIKRTQTKDKCSICFLPRIRARPVVLSSGSHILREVGGAVKQGGFKMRRVRMRTTFKYCHRHITEEVLGDWNTSAHCCHHYHYHRPGSVVGFRITITI